MKVKREKSEYGNWFKIHCPFCPYTTRESMGDRMRWVKNHILKMAKNEALDYYVAEDRENQKMPHLEYIKEHTNNEKTIVVKSRVFDDDLKLQE